MYLLVIRPSAIEMTKNAYQWYEEQQNGLGDLFLLELERCYDKLETWPASYAKIKGNFRQLVLTTFPYVIVFEIFDTEVVIFAIFHTSRNPRKKFRK